MAVTALTRHNGRGFSKELSGSTLGWSCTIIEIARSRTSDQPPAQPHVIQPSASALLLAARLHGIAWPTGGRWLRTLCSCNRVKTLTGRVCWSRQPEDAACWWER